jgi:hypothetical protein
MAHQLRFEGEVTEFNDVQILPGVQCPQLLGFKTEEIQQLLTLDPRSPLVKQNPPSRSSSTAKLSQEKNGY